MKVTYLLEGRLTKADGSAYADADNGIMHLFTNIKYQLSGQDIESSYYPGQATTMLGLLKGLLTLGLIPLGLISRWAITIRAKPFWSTFQLV